MTIEEKAKAYDEALIKAKELLDSPRTCFDIVQLKSIFPELLESEDEIHRKWILEYLYEGLRKADEQFKDNFKSAIDWLEKQKEEEGYEAIPVESTLEYKLGFKAGKESEKQKEQEEQNEKPSKPELKTPEWVCGGWDDEYMINTVIGRYSLHAEVAKKRGDTHDYNLSKSMENWLRNMVKPLILEKQKEEKHATIEQVYEKFLSSDTLKSAKENKYIRAQVLWELMHNGIITEVDYQYLTDDKRKPWTAEEYRIAYQKGFEMSEQLKQKEQSLRDFIDDFPYSDEQKEQKPTAIENLAEHIKAEFEGFRNLLKKKGIDYQPGQIYWDDFAKLFVSSARKYGLQKPVEYGDDIVEDAEEYTSKVDCGEYGVEVTEAYIAGALRQRSKKPVEWKINGEPIPTENQSVDIPLVEWSEEEEETINDAIKRVDELQYLGISCGKIREALKMLKSLHLQKLDASKLENFDPVEVLNKIKTEWPMAWEKVVGKQEWSEEDEDIMYSIRSFLIQAEQSGKYGSIQIAQIERGLNWLKSRRPQWKPTEEQMDALAYAIQLLDDGLSPKAAKAGEELEHLREQLKKL